jgi:hypothetical protein
LFSTSKLNIVSDVVGVGAGTGEGAGARVDIPEGDGERVGGATDGTVEGLGAGPHAASQARSASVDRAGRIVVIRRRDPAVRDGARFEPGSLNEPTDAPASARSPNPSDPFV